MDIKKILELKKKHHKLFVGGVIFLSLFIILFFGNMLPDTESSLTESYEILNIETLKTIQNIDVLISFSDNSEESIKKLIPLIEEKECVKSCNINVYDNREAFEYQEEYNAILSSLLPSFEEIQEKIQNWDKKYYIFVAEHFVAMKTFDAESIWVYPYKDFKYEEMISNN